MHVSSFFPSEHNGVPEDTNLVLIIFVSYVKRSTVLGLRHTLRLCVCV